MIGPGVYNITLQRHADFSVEIELKDRDNNPLNLIDWNAASQVWDITGTTKYADFEIEYLSRSEGKIKLKLSSSNTANLPLQSEYDLLLVSPLGVKEYYLEGTITVSEGYTSIP
jgi:hypothetical protein